MLLCHVSSRIRKELDDIANVERCNWVWNADTGKKKRWSTGVALSWEVWLALLHLEFEHIWEPKFSKERGTAADLLSSGSRVKRHENGRTSHYAYPLLASKRYDMGIPRIDGGMEFFCVFSIQAKSCMIGGRFLRILDHLTHTIWEGAGQKQMTCCSGDQC